MKRFISINLFAAALLFFVAPTLAQESQERVIDQVVAQVNEGVITLSRVKREMKSIVDAEVQQGKKREEVQKNVDEKQGELIAGLINEELMIQKAKELGIDAEADVNRRFLEIMKQHNLKTLDALYQEMEKTGVDPKDIREVWRKQAVREAVLQREVFSKVYWGASAKELRNYYDKNRARFTKPETISISEIFLGYAGRDETAVKEKAKRLVTQIRGGADFAKLATENSDPGQVTGGKGTTEKLKVSELNDLIAKPLKAVKVGGVTDPIEINPLGVIILKVDGREQASSESHFDESAVRLAIVSEKGPSEQKKFMATLRNGAYIKINDAFRPLVAPILFSEERKDKVANK
ncbi:MAG: peptidyl-prolyl cis-trans isomerase [Pyrinomonadaceae bacterium]